MMIVMLFEEWRTFRYARTEKQREDSDFKQKTVYSVSVMYFKALLK